MCRLHRFVGRRHSAESPRRNLDAVVVSPRVVFMNRFDAIARVARREIEALRAHAVVERRDVEDVVTASES